MLVKGVLGQASNKTMVINHVWGANCTASIIPKLDNCITIRVVISVEDIRSMNFGKKFYWALQTLVRFAKWLIEDITMTS